MTKKQILAKEKLQMIEEMKRTSKHKVAKKYNVGRSQLSRWEKMERSLRDLVQKGESKLWVRMGYLPTRFSSFFSLLTQINIGFDTTYHVRAVLGKFFSCLGYITRTFICIFIFWKVFGCIIIWMLIIFILINTHQNFQKMFCFEKKWKVEKIVDPRK